MVAATLPLIRGFSRGSPFAYRNGRAVAVETFLGDVRSWPTCFPSGATS